VLRGDADEALEVASANLAPLRIRFASQLHVHSQPHTSFLNFNVHRPPFDDVRARRALNLAFDRTALARRFGGPELAHPTCQMLPRNFPGHQDYCPWTRGGRTDRWHGPALRRARALVRATGTRGATVRFPLRPDDQIATTAAPILAAALRAIGYRPRIEVIANPADFFRRIASVRHRWNLSDGDWVADYPSPAQFLSFVICSSYHPEDPALTTNSGGYCDRRLDRLVARADALQLTDPAAAQAIWADADRRAVDRAPWVPLLSNSAVEFLSRRAGHFTLDPTGQPRVDQLWVR
jgi:peptide/nickel transport system substrate-binding protein